jgi:hypothetical protein
MLVVVAEIFCLKGVPEGFIKSLCLVLRLQNLLAGRMGSLAVHVLHVIVLTQF